MSEVLSELRERLLQDESQVEGCWVDCKERNPPQGDYVCKITSTGFGSSISPFGKIDVRRIKGKTWFGGVRPFSDNETVTHWWEQS